MTSTDRFRRAVERFDGANAERVRVGRAAGSPTAKRPMTSADRFRRAVEQFDGAKEGYVSTAAPKAP